jgi:hypothetical protein
MSFLPFRIFLDSNALQALLEHGGSVWENEPYSAAANRSGASAEDIAALRLVFAVAERAHFDFALSENTLAEVADARDSRYWQWALDVLDHWHACAAAPGAFDGSGTERAASLDLCRLGYLSDKDGRLIRDAVVLECDTFLTIERRLAKNAAHLGRITGLTVLRPPQLAEHLEPAIGLL